MPIYVIFCKVIKGLLKHSENNNSGERLFEKYIRGMPCTYIDDDEGLFLFKF